MTYHEHMTVHARTYVCAVLEEHAGNVTQAARASGLNRASFYRMMGHLGLSANDKRPFRPYMSPVHNKLVRFFLVRKA